MPFNKRLSRLLARLNIGHAQAFNTNHHFVTRYIIDFKAVSERVLSRIDVAKRGILVFTV